MPIQTNGYIAVTGVDKETGNYHSVIIDPKTYNVVQDVGMSQEANIVRLVRNGFTPLNFSVGRDGRMMQDCGDFNRFSPRGSAVIIAAIESRGGRTLGYRLLSCLNNSCINLRLEDILQREAAMGKEHFLQNGVVRNKTVNCYPLHPFPIMTVDEPRRAGKAVAKVGSPQQKQSVPTQRPAPTQSVVKTPKKPFSQEQLKEAASCQAAGVDPKLIKNPDLDAMQMRILWVSKSKGCKSEAFADPRISSDAMKFYADRLYDDQTVAECDEMLQHPELTVDQLTELYDCVVKGVPYSDYIGMTPTEIEVEREKKVAKYWGSSKTFDGDYLEKATRAAMKIMGEQ